MSEFSCNEIKELVAKLLATAFVAHLTDHRTGLAGSQIRFAAVGGRVAS